MKRRPPLSLLIIALSVVLATVLGAGAPLLIKALMGALLAIILGSLVVILSD